MNLDHFAARVSQFEKKYEDGITREEFTDLLTEKINDTDMEYAKK